jgi:hypothetical protein
MPQQHGLVFEPFGYASWAITCCCKTMVQHQSWLSDVLHAAAPGPDTAASIKHVFIDQHY